MELTSTVPVSTPTGFCCSCSTEQLVPVKGSMLPTRRAYHTMDIIDHKIYIFGEGRLSPTVRTTREHVCSISTAWSAWTTPDGPHSLFKLDCIGVWQSRAGDRISIPQITTRRLFVCAVCSAYYVMSCLLPAGRREISHC